MSTRHRAVRSIAVALATVVAAVAWPTPIGASQAPPSLALVGSTKAVHVGRYSGEPIWLDLGVYVASRGGAFELHARRRGSGWTVNQVDRSSGQAKVVRRLSFAQVMEYGGLADFFVIEIRDAAGKLVTRRPQGFCPNIEASAARTSDDGPDHNPYPGFCHASTLTRAHVWGVPHHWAVPAWAQYGEDGHDLPDGSYTARLSIADAYRKALNIPPAQARVDVGLTITTLELPPCEECPELDAHTHHRRPHDAPGFGDGEVSVPADANGRPDLAALPAFSLGIHVDEHGREWLEFAADVWNAGPGPLVVEGFRRPGTDIMDADQIFYTKGAKTGRARVGTMEFDRADGHHHWHFTDFARYRLLDRNKQKPVRSTKEAFCLANTDPIDLTLPGANWTPGSTGLRSACGGSTSLWVREVLDAGWGDTYHQSLPGQSFDITDLPNGIYYIEVTANPEGRLVETTAANNTALRKLRISGTAPGRTVVEL